LLFECFTMERPGPEDRRPGDITITPLRNGYLLGRVLPERGPGPWWEYVGIESDFEKALAHARHLARRDEVNAWLFDGHDRYRLLPADEPESEPLPESSPGGNAESQKAIVRTRRVNAPPSVKASHRSRRP
jgi:hypothetical protein